MKCVNARFNKWIRGLVSAEETVVLSRWRVEMNVWFLKRADRVIWQL